MSNANERSIHLLSNSEESATCLQALRRAGLRVHPHRTPSSAQAALLEAGACICVASCASEGEELARWARTQAPSVRVILITPHMDGEGVHRAYEAGAAFCARPGRDVVDAVDFLQNGLSAPTANTNACDSPSGRGADLQRILTLSIPLASSF